MPCSLRFAVLKSVQQAERKLQDATIAELATSTLSIPLRGLNRADGRSRPILCFL
jgi:hypothetical protein